MNCSKCGHALKLRAEFCPRCGERAVYDFKAVAAQVHSDAASDRGEKVEAALNWLLILALMLGAFLYGINDMYDKPVVFDGAAIPSLQASGNVSVEAQTLEQPYVDPRPERSIAQQPTKVFGYRREPLRGKLRFANGGDASDANVIGKALKFLSANQNGDGSWPVTVLPTSLDPKMTKDYQWGKVGVTSLALLAFLGEGETWLDEQGAKSLHATTIHKAVKYLVAQQDVSGRFGPAGDGGVVHYMYNQAMATLAVAEAAGLTGDEFLRGAAQKGIDEIVRAQTATGGWNYHGRLRDFDDTSVSAWCVQAFYGAREAGLAVSEDALSKALQLYVKATKPDGLVQYQSNQTRGDPVESLPAVALMVRQLLGEEQGARGLKQLEARAVMLAPKTRKEWGQGWVDARNPDQVGERAKYDPYKIYFGTYSLFFAGGKNWETWNAAMRKSVLEMQDHDGAWRTNDIWSAQGGTVYSTALHVLALQVYYRIQ